ncbi:MAG: hypothetical protein GY838_05180 [bacterium]|nr:hypothetical protein [bacterium]
MRLVLLVLGSLVFLSGCSDSDDPGRPAPRGVTVEITSPADGSLHGEGSMVTFTGTASDPDGAALSGSALVWSTADDGDPFGTGESVAKTMGVGVHTIVLTATDPADNTGTDSVTITVAAIDPLPWNSYSGMKSRLMEIVDLADANERDRLLDAYADSLRVHGQFPFVAADSVAFFYRGTADPVAFAGDFNGWDPAQGPATRLGDTDLWVREEVFPLDSRLDYKIVLNGANWILDPENPRLQRGGYGDNSVLPMPDYVPSPYVVRQTGVEQGSMVSASLASTNLGYTVDYQVYLPARYPRSGDLPVMYVTDGHEYADDAMGSMVIVLDNLIDAGLIPPIMAVFVDPRVGGTNLRGEQYVLNQDFVDFVADELVPVIDGTYATSTSRLNRGILGTSLGGLNSAWFALQAHEEFYRIGIQSPAFWLQDEAILDQFDDATPLDVDIFMTWGTFHDMGDVTERFRAILDAKGYQYSHRIVNEGHSWGNWRALLDDILIGFWGTP